MIQNKCICYVIDDRLVKFLILGKMEASKMYINIHKYKYTKN